MPRRDLDRLEAEATRKVLRILREARERVTSLLLADYRKRRGEDDDEYDAAFARSKKAALDVEISRLERDLSREVEGALRKATNAAEAYVESAGKMNVVVDARVVRFAMESAAEEVVGVSNAVRSSIRRTIMRTVSGGLSHGEMVEGIRESFGGKATAARVERIVRTEVGRAYQQQRAALEESLDEAGADLVKRWVSHRDDSVRDSHLLLDGQERELSDLFNVGGGASDRTPPTSTRGWKANGPLDPSLPAGEAIQCRCDVLLVPRAQATQRYIRKTSPRDKRRRLRIAAGLLPTPVGVGRVDLVPSSGRVLGGRGRIA